MNIKRIIAIAAAAAMLALSAACGSNTASSSSSEPKADTTSPTGYYSDDIIAAVDGPQLMFSNVEAAAGETAEVSHFVSGAANKWTMCGLHITYGKDLEPVMSDAAQSMVEFDLGDASKRSSGSVCMLWESGLPKELTDNDLGSIFFTEIFDGDKGGDGEIVKFYFKVPEKAKKGTVYPIGIYYMPPTDERSDMFIGTDGDKSREKYAFQNWTGGSITVK